MSADVGNLKRQVVRNVITDSDGKGREEMEFLRMEAACSTKTLIPGYEFYTTVQHRRPQYEGSAHWKQQR
jgi:hypothetical protein